MDSRVSPVEAGNKDQLQMTTLQNESYIDMMTTGICETEQNTSFLRYWNGRVERVMAGQLNANHEYRNRQTPMNDQLK